MSAFMRSTIATVTVLALLVTLKALFNPSPLSDTKFDDGAYYYQVARHVRDGDGFVTSVSLYNDGFKRLPHQALFYPLWPLLLGLTGRVLDLQLAAQILPETLYFVALALLYALANHVASAFGLEGTFCCAGPSPSRQGTS